ncbi:hypothetical protein EF36P3_00003 [Enterococcus phage EF36P3]|nr:hypothetical protein EF36P3_00003 [Enterococcus phage EF36P3]
MFFIALAVLLASNPIFWKALEEFARVSIRLIAESTFDETALNALLPIVSNAPNPTFPTTLPMPPNIVPNPEVTFPNPLTAFLEAGSDLDISSFNPRNALDDSLSPLFVPSICLLVICCCRLNVSSFSLALATCVEFSPNCLVICFTTFSCALMALVVNSACFSKPCF